jgi:rhodanese-related sulfurtransferase
MTHSERFEKLVDEARSRVAEITPDQTHAMQRNGEDFLLVDTREDNEWERGHVAGAIHLGKGIIERDIEKIAPELDRAIVLYCGGGYRSVLAADALARMGYTNVMSMAEGWRGWTSRGLPTE